MISNDFPLKKFAQEKKDQDNGKKRPIKTKWIPLGESFAVKFSLWDNNLTIQKFTKAKGVWEVSEEIHLTRRVLTELCPRISDYIAIMDQLEEKTRS